jgi:phage host-nuclease inhibitor protein Gam
MRACEQYDDWPEEDTSNAPEDDAAARLWVQRKLERISQLRDERAKMQAVADDMRARADEFERREIGEQDRAIAYHEFAVESWMQTRLQAVPKVRSYPFPSGRVQARKLPDRIEIDPEVVDELLVKRPDLARPIPARFELDKTALNEAVAAGEEFDGVTVESGRVKITIVTEGM